MRRGSLERRLALGLLVGAVTGAPAERSPVRDRADGPAGRSRCQRPVAAYPPSHPPAGPDHRDRLPPGLGPVMGTVVGCGSAVNGTSGPALLVPAMIAARVPTRRAVAVSQASQAIVAPPPRSHTSPPSTSITLLLAGLSIASTLGYCAGHGASRLLQGSKQHTLVALIVLGCAAADHAPPGDAVLPDRQRSSNRTRHESP